MKKQTIILIVVLIIMFLIVTFAVAQNIKKEKELANYNKQYEQYCEKQIYGTDLATLINKAINDNEKNNVDKDENGYYIQNGTNSVKIFIKLQEEGENFPMERIFKRGITEFVKNFNLETFKCTQINYHEQTKKISEIYFEVI